MRAGDTFGPSRGKIRTRDIDSRLDRFVLIRPCRRLTRCITVEFDAHIAIHARQSGRGIHDKTDKCSESHPNENFPCLAHQ